jgi:hypothetical protein
MIWHLLPIKDIDEHLEKSNCKCLPVAEVLDNGDIMITHNSFDKREVIECLFENDL